MWIVNQPIFFCLRIFLQNLPFEFSNFLSLNTEKRYDSTNNGFDSKAIRSRCPSIQSRRRRASNCIRFSTDDHYWQKWMWKDYHYRGCVTMCVPEFDYFCFSRNTLYFEQLPSTHSFFMFIYSFVLSLLAHSPKPSSTQ